VDTPLQAPYLTEELRKEFQTGIPLGRIAHPREIAFAALYLASEESAFMTGAELVVDGGFMAQ
jgi:NAD(P)-dependent dehydrogenase (short-subunit alcohol dehydrogenase family)